MNKCIPFILISLLIQGQAFPLSKKELSERYGKYLKGLIHFERREYKEALSEFKTLKQIDPGSVYTRLKVAFVLVKMGELDSAEKELKEIKILDPENLEASLGLIFLYSYSEKDKELEAEYGDFLERAHKLRPEDIRISEYLAQFYFYKNRLDDAIKIYGAIVEEHPEYFDARYLLGYLHEENGNRDDAIRIWKEILETNPSHTDTLNSLGYIYAERGEELDEAENLIKKALEQDADNGAYLDSLGWVYFKKKDYEKAETYLKRAIDKVKDPVIYEHLGDLYVELKDVDKAIDYYSEGLKVNPENTRLKEKLQKHEKESKTSQEKSEPDKEINN